MVVGDGANSVTSETSLRLVTVLARSLLHANSIGEFVYLQLAISPDPRCTICFVLLYCSCHNFNLLLHGVGSKQHLINNFIGAKLSDVPHVVVNGFFPSLTIKSVSLVC